MVDLCLYLIAINETLSLLSWPIIDKNIIVHTGTILWLKIAKIISMLITMMIILCIFKSIHAKAIIKIEPLHEKTYELAKIIDLYFFVQKLSSYIKWSASEI